MTEGPLTSTLSSASGIIYAIGGVIFTITVISALLTFNTEGLVDAAINRLISAVVFGGFFALLAGIFGAIERAF
jgi:hypothetical protein